MQKLKENLRIFFSRLCQWALEHPVEAITLAIAVFGVGRKLTKPIREAIERYKQNHPNELFDPSLGVMQKLKRRLTDKDKERLSKMYDEGVSRHDALKELHLI